MSQIAIIIFREILEISIIISIIAAATKDLKNRTHYINLGLIAGIIGSIFVIQLLIILIMPLGKWGMN